MPLQDFKSNISNDDHQLMAETPKNHILDIRPVCQNNELQLVNMIELEEPNSG